MAPKDAERQLSKKELKKKELEELEAVLAELGYTNKETSGQDDTHGNVAFTIICRHSIWFFLLLMKDVQDYLLAMYLI